MDRALDEIVSERHVSSQWLCEPPLQPRIEGQVHIANIPRRRPVDLVDLVDAVVDAVMIALIILVMA
jgi:hypothetical protein